MALGLPPGKEDVPGPMVEDGPPAQVTVEDVVPVVEDPQESQSMVDLETRSRIFNCQLQFPSSDLKSGKDLFSFLHRNDLKCNFTFQPDGGSCVQVFPIVAGATGSSEGQGALMMPRFGQTSPEREHHMFIL